MKKQNHIIAITGLCTGIVYKAVFGGIGIAGAFTFGLGWILVPLAFMLIFLGLGSLVGMILKPYRRKPKQ